MWLYLYIPVCVHPQVHVAFISVRAITRSGEETRRLHESLDRMSGLCKNTMKEPKTESCQKLLCCMEMLNVLSRGSTSTCGGGRPVINHTSQQNPKEMPLFLVPAWCSELHQSYSVQSVRHKKGKQSLKTREFLHLKKLYSAVRYSRLFQISMQMISSADHQCGFCMSAGMSVVVSAHIRAYECLCINLYFNPTICH